MNLKHACGIFFMACIQLSSSTLEPSQTTTSNEAQKLFDEFWDWKISEFPESATYVGIHENDAYLNDVSESSFLYRYHKCQDFLTKAKAILPTLTNKSDITSMTILQYEVEMFVKYFHLKGYYLPVNYRQGPHITIKKILERMPSSSVYDFYSMLRRMEKVPQQLDQIINLMKAGVENNVTNHEISMKNLNESIGAYVVDDPTESPLFEVFNGTFPESFTPEDINDIQTRAQDLITDKITPAYSRLLDYVLNDYVTREDIAITSVPNGKEIYDALIQFHTSTNLTPQEIHNIGIKEVEKIENEMIKIIKEMGEDQLTLQEFREKIRDDPKNYFNTSEEIVEEFTNIIYNRINPRLSNLFKTIPKTKIEVKVDVTPYGTGAYYQSGSDDGAKPGVFYIRTYYPNSIPKYSMMSLAIHESNPGHHFQISYANESPNMPMFRKRTGLGIANAQPARFPSYTYVIEGWALYAEGLGIEMDLYTDPLERFGHYNEEIFRAVRLVVDTGMHALGWTRQEAVDYFFSHTAFIKVEAESEIDRYITWPGQALGYKIGQLKIRGLRLEAETRLGETFDIKEFHEVILNSIGPFQLIESEVREWIEATKAKQDLQTVGPNESE